MDLTGKQVKAINLLASGGTCREAAKAVSVTPQTITAWKKQSGFVAELNRAKRDGLEAARAKLQHLAGDAVDVLIDLARNAEAEEVRRKAAIDLVGLAGLASDTTDVFAWGIGPTEEDEVASEWQRAEMRKLLYSSI